MHLNFSPSALTAFAAHSATKSGPDLLSCFPSYYFCSSKAAISFPGKLRFDEFHPHENTSGLLWLMVRTNSLRGEGLLFDWLYWLAHQHEVKPLDLALLEQLKSFKFSKLLQVLIYLVVKKGQLGKVVGLWLLLIEVRSGPKSRAVRLIAELARLLPADQPLLQYGMTLQCSKQTCLTHLLSTKLYQQIPQIYPVQADPDCNLSSRIRTEPVLKQNLQANSAALQALLAHRDVRIFHHASQTLIIFAKSPLISRVNQLLGCRLQLFVNYIKGAIKPAQITMVECPRVSRWLVQLSSAKRLDKLIEQLQGMMDRVDAAAKRRARQRLRVLLG